MKNNKEVKISYWAAHLTTIVSVTLVLIIIGIIFLVSAGAASETRRMREKLEVSVVMADTISNSLTKAISERIAVQPYALEVDVITKEEALQNWKKDTGEDLEALFGVNPLSPEITFTLKSEYATEEGFRKIDNFVSAIPGVEATVMPDSALVEAMNRNIERISLMLGIVALVMIIISFVLINNTVHLAIYARRFTIHTMQLVGATDGFIRRPFVNNNMLSGLVAGLLASSMLAIALAAAPNAGFENVGEIISWQMWGITSAALVAVGVCLCGFAAWVATSRYLHRDYDELFK